jgi:protein TonB
MDNRTSNNDDNKWVEESIAKLAPPSGWRPDADQAFERMMQQRRKPASISPMLRLSLAGAMIATIALIVTLLPWQTLWTPQPKEEVVATEKLAEHVETAAQPGEAHTVPEPQQAPSTPETPRNNPKDLPAEETKPGGTPPTGPTAPAPQTGPSQEQPRSKKKGQPFASLQEQGSGPGPSVASHQGAQGQNPQSPDSGVTPPTLLSRVTPEYTPEARQARVTGTIELVVTVREDGTVKFERITKSLGFGLDEASAAAAEQFTFRPGRKDGKPVAVSVSLQFTFGLK